MTGRHPHPPSETVHHTSAHYNSEHPHKHHHPQDTEQHTEDHIDLQPPHHTTYHHRYSDRRSPYENEPILYPESKPKQSMEDRAQKCCDPFYISCFLLLLGFGCGAIGGYLYFKNGGGTQSMLGYVAAGGILVFLVGVYIMYEYTKVCLCCHRAPDA